MLNYRRLISWVALFILIPAVHSFADSAPTARDVVMTLEQGYGTLADLQASFSQRTTISSVNREERGAGELFIKKSSGAKAMFRFNYTKPQQQIISNGKTVWYYLPENRQVIVSDLSKLFEGGGGIALNYLTGLGRISADFTSTLSGEGRDKKGNYVLDLVPRKPSPVMTKLTLTVSAKAVEEFMKTGTARDPFPILSSVVFDQLGNKTRIDFSRVRVNQGVGSGRFGFKPPAGVEVIKQ